MASKTIEVNEKLTSIVECCICTEMFTDPRMLPCFHTFCANCLKEIGLKTKKGPGDKLLCPQCRTEFTVPLDGFMGLQKNFFVDKLLEVINISSKSTVCDMNAGKCSSVKWYCEDCRQNLCDQCSKLHNTKRTSTGLQHALVPYEDRTEGPAIDQTLVPLEDHTERSTTKQFDLNHPMFCDQHETEKLKLFCNDCHTVLCTFCFLENHQSHKWSKVTEAARIYRMQTTKNIDMLSSCVSETKGIIEQLDKNNMKFIETVSNVESSVKTKKIQVKALLEKIVDEEASSLLQRITSLTHEVSKQNDMEKEELCRHQTMLDSHITFSNEIAAKGSDVNICRSANELDNRAKELKELHGTVMERKPVKSEITFAEKKSEDFLKTFNSNLLGKIDAHVHCLKTSSDLDRRASQTSKSKATDERAIIMDPKTEQNLCELISCQNSSQKLYEKIRGIMDKMTFSTFENLWFQMTELPIDNEETLSACVEILFEKAISEPTFAKQYSILAQRTMSLSVPSFDNPAMKVTFRKLLLKRCQEEFEKDRQDELSVPSTDNPAMKVTFRKLLLNRCQEEFEKDQQDEQDIIRRQKEIEETTREDQRKSLIEEKKQLVARSRRRSLGNIRFIGELFKLKMLTEKIMHECIKKLLDAEDEDSLELLCHLLKTIGMELDTYKAKKLMDSYFDRLGDKQGSVPSRIRFMIRDLLEQRKNNWIPI